jgi:hypothetical protein
MENIGNNIIQAGGGKVDTGKKFIDANGDPHVIYRKTLALDGTTSSLPNATSKNVAHGEAIALNKYAKVKELRADNATTIKTLESTGITAEINATNVVITTASDLSAYVRGLVTIEFCL